MSRNESSPIRLPLAALAVALNCDQGVYYKNLSRRRQKDEKFVYGWLKNRVLDQVRDL